MQIDWFTLIAQIVNFLILLVLLKKVLFDRIVKAMDERQQKISSELQEAEDKQQKAQETLEEYQSKREHLEEERQDILNQAKQEAEDQKEEWTREARQAVDNKRQQWEQALQQQREEFRQTLKRRSGQQVYNIARKVLSDMANLSLEQQMVQVFQQKLQTLDDEETQDVNNAVAENEDAMKIRTTFELEEDLREDLKATLHDTFTDDLRVDFETESNMICGIDLRAGDQSITWSIDDYLQSLEQMFQELLEEHIRSSGASEEQVESKEETTEPSHEEN